MDVVQLSKRELQGVGAMRLRVAVDWACVVATYALSLLVLVAFQPSVPQLGLDDSWRYAIDTASAQHLPFGRAIVFTFGPLGSLYSNFYIPIHDHLYLSLKVFITIGIVSAFVLISQRSRRPFLLILPIFLANLLVEDALFFILPIALLVACDQQNLPRLAWGSAICVISATLGLLPLIKGTMSIPVIFCVVPVSLLLLRAKSGWSLAIPTMVIGALLIAWVLCGQQLHDLPIYFQSQFAVAGGFTDAMSIFDDPVLIYVYIGVALVLIASIMNSGGKARVAKGFAFLCIGFVAFKAGFARQDGHAVIAATTLALFGYIVFLHDSRRRAVLAMIVGLGGWAVVAGHYVSVGPAEDWSRFVDKIATSAQAIVTRVTAPEQTFARFAAAKAEIRSQVDLPRRPGTADIYPFDLSWLLSSDLEWNPRPVIQSYAAYTPELAALNASHLRTGSAPETLYFSIQPIDDRYPNLDDGASWPAILSRYDFDTFSGPFATLVKSPHEHPAMVDAPFFRASVPFDTDIPIPPDMHDVWAQFTFHPTTSGRLLSLLFKRPILTMEVTYRDGTTRTARMIAGMAAGGFLLSPTIESSRDFVLLKAADPSLLTSREVRSFRLHQATSVPFWGTEIDVQLAALILQPDHSVDRDIYGALSEGEPLAAVPVGGECSIDVVGDQRTGNDALIVPTSAVRVQGWAMISTGGKVPNHGVRLALTDDDGNTRYAEATRTARLDVVAYFHLDRPEPVGFEASVDLRALKGHQTIHIVQDGPNGPLACPSQVADIIHD